MQEIPDNLVLLIVIGTVGMLLLALAIIVLNIQNQNRRLRLKQQEQLTLLEHQKELLSAIINSQEIERRRIGQDLHDDIGSALSGLRLSLDIFKPSAADLPNYLKLNKQWKQTIDTIMVELRHIAHHLSPSLLTLHGLTAALNKQLETINNSGGLVAVLNDKVPEITGSLSITTATALYRVLEELINNTIKHAHATTIKIDFQEENGIFIVYYTDNGIGILQSSPKGMGMQNIESRLSFINATFEMKSEPGKGVKITILIP